MKNRLIVSILMLFVGMSAAFSQGDARPRPFELGVFASPALSWLHPTTDGYNNKGVVFSGSYGINLDINMFQATSNYFFRTGVNIRHMGGKLTYSEQDLKIDSTISIVGSKDVLNKFNMIYISVPTALKLQTNPLADKYIIYSVFGLDNSFCVSATKQKTEDGKTPENDNKNNKEYTFPIREALILSARLQPADPPCLYTMYRQNHANPSKQHSSPDDSAKVSCNSLSLSPQVQHA